MVKGGGMLHESTDDVVGNGMHDDLLADHVRVWQRSTSMPKVILMSRKIFSRFAPRKRKAGTITLIAAQTFLSGPKTGTATDSAWPSAARQTANPRLRISESILFNALPGLKSGGR